MTDVYDTSAIVRVGNQTMIGCRCELRGCELISRTQTPVCAETVLRRWDKLNIDGGCRFDEAVGGRVWLT